MFKGRFVFVAVIAIFFLIVGWPFAQFPLTDGDIAHWVPWAKDMALHGHFLSAKTDQAHGPLLPWATAVFIRLFSLNYYVLNVFNALCGVGCVGLVYVLYRRMSPQGLSYAGVPMVFAASNFVMVYLSRTPMYDFPAAFGYTLFCYAYALWRKENKHIWLLFAVVGLGIGVLSRFAVVVGLSCFFVLAMEMVYGAQATLWTRFRRLVGHGLVLFGCAVLWCLPWILVQHTYHPGFLEMFFYDNVLRFLGDEKGVSRDYYGFLLMTFIALIPTTPVLVAGFSRRFWRQWVQSDVAKVAMAASLPCLILFSFSGHTKLLRYIAYVFPSLLLLSGHVYLTCVSDPVYRKRMRYWYYGLLGVVGIVLSIYAIQFNQEAQQSGLFVWSAIVFLFGLIGSGFVFLVKQHTHFLKKPLYYLVSCAVFYLIFFTVLSMEYTRVPFLFQVRDMIDSALQGVPHG